MEGLSHLGRSFHLVHEIELVLREVDGDHPRGTAGDGAEQGREPDAAEPDHRDRLAGLDPRRVHGGADAGQHGAAEERGDLGGHVGIHLHDRGAADDGVARKPRDAEVVEDLASRLAVQADAATHERARAVRGRADLARQAAVGAASVQLVGSITALPRPSQLNSTSTKFTRCSPGTSAKSKA